MGKGFGIGSAHAADSLIPLKPVSCDGGASAGKSMKMELSSDSTFQLQMNNEKPIGFSMAEKGVTRSFALKPAAHGDWKILDQDGKETTAKIDRDHVRALIDSLSSVTSACSDPAKLAALNEQIAQFNKSQFPAPGSTNKSAPTVN